MGANAIQALAVVLFLTAFVPIAGSLADGGNVILFLVGLVLLAISIALCRKAKPLEYQERD